MHSEERSVKVEGSFRVEAPIERVWQLFLDPQQLCRVMPGCEEARQIDATHYQATLSTKVQFMTIRAHMAAEIVEREEPAHVVVVMTGDTIAMAGSFHMRMTVDLKPDASGTAVRYDIDLTMLGRLGSLGQPIVRTTAKRLSDEFANNVTASLEERGTISPPSP